MNIPDLSTFAEADPKVGLSGGGIIAVITPPDGGGGGYWPSPTPTPGVPDGAAWAYLLVGFGLVGVAARRRPKWQQL